MADECISSFVAEQRKLLALELQADEEQHGNDDDDNEGASHVLGNLEASDISVGLFGRTVIRFTLWSEKPGNLLPAHRLTVGDEVEIRTKQKPPKGFPAGVVCEASETQVAVALLAKGGDTKGSAMAAATDDDENDDEGGFNNPPLTLVPRSSAEVHSKLLQALSNLERLGGNHPVAGPVIHAMFQPLDVPPPRPMSSADWQPFNPRLDSSQQEAIAFALQSDRPIALIHGPPGTGKTTTVTELIQQAVHIHKLKVLVTAPSNVAVDNVLERLVATPSTIANKKGRKLQPTSSKLRAVRLGHPARLKSSILSYSLEALVQNADGTEIVADVRQELQSYLRIVSNPKSRGTDKRLAYRELKSLRKEIRSREEKVVQELITTAQVVLATTVGAANRILDHVDAFDLVVIDEAAQALEASCWIPILRGKRVVLAGDHCQLPPTIKSKSKAAQQGLGRTMFERLMHLYGDDKPTNNKLPKISRMLTVQYRMHEMIANWASEVMYHGQLQTHESVQKRTLLQLEGFHRPVTEQEELDDKDDDDVSETPLLLIDTSGCGMHELVNPAGSRYNPGEATLVARHVQTLVKSGLKPEQMCVITPYNGQVEYLRNMILPDFPTLEIRSVDGFQGGEREAVILSLVRSSDRGGKDGIGFLKDDRRQNVAVTRAKRHLAIICDSETVSQSKFIATLIDWVQEHGEQRSAIEFQSSSKANQDDLKLAEEVLLQIMEPIQTQPTSAKKNPGNKSTTMANTITSQNLGPEARQGLMDKIAVFAEKANPGEEMHLSSTLTSFDRRVVHEFAEQIGLGHRSEGVEGKDRRIILQKQEKPLDPIVAAATISTTSPDEAVAVPALPVTKQESDEMALSRDLPFSVLALDDDDDSDSNSDFSSNGQDNSVQKGEVTHEQGPPDNNSLLASLAKERAARQKDRMAGPTPTGPGRTVGTTTKKPNKGQKLGGTKKVASTKAVEEDKLLDDLDDMAFLDAQIEKAHNSHGRKVVGTGKGYRTIVNGILNTTPQPRPAAPTNSAAAATLQAKLKEAQNGRKAKINKKKK